MKICLVSDAYYPHPGGVTEHIHHAAAELRRRGHSVKILTADYGDNNGFSGADVERIGRSILVPINKSLATITVGVSMFWKVRKFIRENAFDIVHTHGPLAPTLPFLALRASQSVNIATFHAARDTTPHYEVFSPFLRGMFRRIHGPIAVSEVARKSIARYFPGHYTIIPNGVDTGRFNTEVEPIARYRDGRPNILFVGRFDLRKGLQYLLMAMPEILRSIPDARLLVVGNGRQKSRYERLLSPKVREATQFVGYVEPEEIPRYYATGDIYCSPATEAESFGITILEAMASGTPLVAFGNDGFRCVVEDGKDGLLVTPRDHEALARAIIGLLNNPRQRARLRANGLAKAEGFSWARVARTLDEYYRDTMARVETR